MLMTKVLFVIVLICGILNITGWERSTTTKFSYIVMWIIAILQILTRLLEG